MAYVVVPWCVAPAGAGAGAGGLTTAAATAAAGVATFTAFIPPTMREKSRRHPEITVS